MMMVIVKVIVSNIKQYVMNSTAVCIHAVFVVAVCSIPVYYGTLCFKKNVVNFRLSNKVDDGVCFIPYRLCDCFVLFDFSGLFTRGL